jgi:hypothetical protein
VVAAAAAAGEGGEDGDDRRGAMALTRLMTMTLALLALAVGGCTTYYRVKDTTSGRTYYTEEIKRRNGTVIFRDTKSGAEVTLPSSEIAEVPQEEYQKNTAK